MAFAEQPAAAARFLCALTRCAENGFGRDVEAAASLLCREAAGEHQTWAALKDLPHGPHDRTRLMHAAFRGDKARVRWLLARGARLELRDVHGKTALMWAAEGGSLAAVRALLGAGADVRAVALRGLGNALAFAARGGHGEAAAELSVARTRRGRMAAL